MIFPAFAAAIVGASRQVSCAYRTAARAFRERDERSRPKHRLLSSGRGNGISSQEREYLVARKSCNAMSRSGGPPPRGNSSRTAPCANAAGIPQNLTRKA